MSTQVAPIMAALERWGWNLTHIPNTHHHFEQSCVAKRSRLSRVAEWLRREALIATIGMSGVRFRVGGGFFP